MFGGDTAQTPLFASYRRYGPYDAAIMPIGAYDPYIHNHCTPEQSVSMADAAGARLFVPVHHKTFQLSHEPFHEPIERTEAALAAEADRLVVRSAPVIEHLLTCATPVRKTCRPVADPTTGRSCGAARVS